MGDLTRPHVFNASGFWTGVLVCTRHRENVVRQAKDMMPVARNAMDRFRNSRHSFLLPISHHAIRGVVDAPHP